MDKKMLSALRPFLKDDLERLDISGNSPLNLPSDDRNDTKEWKQLIYELLDCPPKPPPRGVYTFNFDILASGLFRDNAQ